MGFDEVARGLQNRSRRCILKELLEHNPASVSEVVPIRADGRNERIELVHTHLPRLDDLGYIAWDRESGRISRGPRWEEIEPILELIDENEERIPDDTF